MKIEFDSIEEGFCYFVLAVLLIGAIFLWGVKG